MMTNIIEKTAFDTYRYYRPHFKFTNARAAFMALLKSLSFKKNEYILLPAYIGWSSKEGSGVFDPVIESGLPYDFYRISRNMLIDVDDVCEKMLSNRVKLLVLIHFFGYPDPQADCIANFARKQGILVLEDEAHALYSDLVGGICGRLGDFCIYSLHKMLPFKSGGVLVLNNLQSDLINRLENQEQNHENDCSLMNYDLIKIAETRRSNALKLADILKELEGKVELLYPSLGDGIVPQTLPVIIKGSLRDTLYFSLNKQGFGVVSLYHSLINQINRDSYSESYWLADHILNLPVHQDVSYEDLFSMICSIKNEL